jgi:hypothetical protein
MRILSWVGILVLSTICSWSLTWYSCVELLPGLRLFDFVCGHNSWLQMLPSFFLFATIFAILSALIGRRIRK